MAASDPQYLLIYEYVDDMEQRRGPHRGAHLERITAAREAGQIGAAGAFDPPTGAAIVFSGVDREQVEAFVTADPYQRAGLITGYRIERWKQV